MIKKDIGCWACSKPFTAKDSYMVKESVWAIEAELPVRHPLFFFELHASCLEKYLKRKLVPEDFTKPVGYMMSNSNQKFN